MDNVYQLGLRSQTIVGGCHFLFWLFSWPFVIGFLKDYHDKDRLTFNCIPKPNDFTRQRCYDNYTSAVSPGLTPLDFAGMNYGALGFLWLFFMLMGAMTLRRINRERSEQGKINQWKKFMRRFVYHVCAQLVVLSVMMGLFCAYQTIHLPSEYKCYQTNMTLTSFNQRPVNMTCNDLRYKEKSKLNIAIIVIMTISIVFCLFTLIHLGVTRRTGLLLPEHLLGDIFEREDGNAERVTLRGEDIYISWKNDNEPVSAIEL